LRYLPDPAEPVDVRTRRQSRAALGISDGQAAILVFGSIDERKGIDSLLAAVTGPEGMENYVVILAGKHSAAMQARLRAGPAAEPTARKPLIVMDRVLSDAERDQVFSAADVVWVGYRNHAYMSGVLVLAGRAGLPVVGTSEGEIGRLIAEYRFGIAARIDRQAEVISALRAMLDAGTRTAMGQRALSAFADHTVENFGASVLEVLERAEAG
jgi:glycosyltransferase involved in cell wall biosynthesis